MPASMSDYNVQLEVFEGPLALLLHLIEKNKIDIYDIPIAEITEQYLAYLQQMENFNIEVASAFIVMAATLLQIKSRLLLPKPPAALDDCQDEPDARQELVDRLLEYRRFKAVSEALAAKAEAREKLFARLPQHFDIEYKLPDNLKIDDLIKAFAALWESTIEETAVIDKEEVSISDKMADIVHLLRNSGSSLEFSQTLIRSGSRNELVAAFLALLELVRMQRVVIVQKRGFGPIKLSLKESATNVL